MICKCCNCEIKPNVSVVIDSKTDAIFCSIYCWAVKNGDFKVGISSQSEKN